MSYFLIYFTQSALWNYIKLYRKKLPAFMGKNPVQRSTVPLQTDIDFEAWNKHSCGPGLGVLYGCSELHHAPFWAWSQRHWPSEVTHTHRDLLVAPIQPLLCLSHCPPSSASFEETLTGLPQTAPNPHLMQHWAISGATAAPPFTYISDPQNCAVAQLLRKV